MGRAPAVLLTEDVGHVEKGGAREADLDERRLHAGQHAHDTAEIDVADNAAPAGALDVQFLHRALQHQRDTGFLRCEIDEEFFIHDAGESQSGRDGIRACASWRGTATLHRIAAFAQ